MNNIKITFHSLSDTQRFIKKHSVTNGEIIADEGTSLTLPLYLLADAEASDFVKDIEEINCRVGGERIVCSNKVW